MTNRCSETVLTLLDWADQRLYRTKRICDNSKSKAENVGGHRKQQSIQHTPFCGGTISDLSHIRDARRILARIQGDQLTTADDFTLNYKAVLTLTACVLSL